LADWALLKLVRLHLQRYEKHLAEVQKELDSIEQQHGISSEECYQFFMVGKMGHVADIASGWGCMTMSSFTESVLRHSEQRLRLHNA
jgi:hypothetical protein